MLNSAEILSAHKYKNIKKFSPFSGPNKLIMQFFLLIHVIVKMPTVVGVLPFMSMKHFTVVGILTFMSRKNFMLS